MNSTLTAAVAPEGVLRAGPAGLPDLAELIGASVASIGAWMSEYGPFQSHPSMDVSIDDLLVATGDLHDRLRDNYPFFHPRYVGQMLKPPHPAAVIGYLSAMLINPNNHALDGGPATAALEKEVIADLATMFGFTSHLGHLTSSGTIANLEALFVARETHPGKAIAHSADAHYTHARMSHLLGIESVAVATTLPAPWTSTRSRTTSEPAALEQSLPPPAPRASVPSTRSTRSSRSAASYGARLHVDAAYGGFFRLIADDTADGVAAAPLRRDRRRGLRRHRPPQARPAALRLRRGHLPRPRRSRPLPARLPIHLLHLRRPPPRRDLPRVLPRRRRRGRPLAHPEDLAAHARRPRRGAPTRTPRRPRLGGPDRPRATS